jgi:hypothetical protein
MDKTVCTPNDVISMSDQTFQQHLMEKGRDYSYPLATAQIVTYPPVSMMQLAPIPAHLVLDGLSTHLDAAVVYKRIQSCADQDEALLHASAFLRSVLLSFEISHNKPYTTLDTFTNMTPSAARTWASFRFGELFPQSSPAQQNGFGLKRTHDESFSEYFMKQKPRLIFNGTQRASFYSFGTVWLVEPDKKYSNLTQITKEGSLLAADAYLREEYVEMYALIEDKNNNNENVVGLVRGSSGIGKSTFLRYLLAHIREQGVTNVLVVQEQNNGKRHLHLTTDPSGKKIVRELKDIWEVDCVERTCEWTIVDGCDWPPSGNNLICAASPSTFVKEIERENGVLRLCMPPWSLKQLKQFGTLKALDVAIIEENYKIIGGSARHVFAQTT